MVRRDWMWVALAVGILGAVAVQAAPPNLVYLPPVGQTDARNMKVAITDVLLSDAPTGMCGTAQATLQLSVNAPDGDTAQTVLASKLSNVSSDIAGHKITRIPAPPYYLRLNQQALLVALSPSDPQAPAGAGPGPLTPPLAMLRVILSHGAGEMIAQGGVPLQALALQCAFPLLPDHAVAAGDSWQGTFNCDFEGGGAAQEIISVRLDSLDAQTAKLSSSVRYTLPEFEANNPLLPGQKMKVRNAVLEFRDLTQEYDLAKGLVRTAHAKMTVTMEASSPDMNLQIKINAEVSYKGS